jgi:hypothetical protein
MTLVSNTNLLAARIGQEFVDVRADMQTGLAAKLDTADAYTQAQADAQINAAVGSAIGNIRDADGGAFASTDISVYADSSRLPLVDPNGIGGWYFRNAAAGQKINWYPYNATLVPNGSPEVGALAGVWAVVYFYTTTTNFILNLYSKRTGTGDAGSWFKSRFTYATAVGPIPAPAVPGQPVRMLVYWGVNPTVHPNLPRLQISSVMSATSSTGPRLLTEELQTYSWGTNSASAVGREEFTIEQVGHTLAGGDFSRSLIHIGATLAELALKADTVAVNAALGLKADTTTVDAALALKANAADVYTKAETDTAIDTAVNDLIGAAPGTLDTLGEIAAAIEAGEDAGAALVQEVALKAYAADVYTKTQSDAIEAALRAEIGEDFANADFVAVFEAALSPAPVGGGSLNGGGLLPGTPTLV